LIPYALNKGYEKLSVNFYFGNDSMLFFKGVISLTSSTKLQSTIAIFSTLVRARLLRHFDAWIEIIIRLVGTRPYAVKISVVLFQGFFQLYIITHEIQKESA